MDLVSNVESYWDSVRKYSILRNAVTELKMDISFIYENYDELDLTDDKLKDKKDKMEIFQKMKSDDLLRIINDKFNTFADSYKSKFTNNYNFNVGDVVENLLDKTIKVRCIKNDGIVGQITKGKEYPVIEESEEEYLIENDKGKKDTWYKKWLFEKVEDVLIVECIWSEGTLDIGKKYKV